MMEVYIRLHHKRELVAISLPKGSLCQSILEKFSGNGECYIHQNGYYKSPEEELRPGETVDVAGRLLGGKGGFGSMLRAIGAQIEKTTNREACRDLTGRRLRAINDERRFRHYARIKAQREMEREEKRRRKLETLATSEPRHEFDDQEYISERMAIPERVEQALEDAFSEEPGPSAAACQSGSTSTQQLPKKKLKGWMEDELEGLDDFESENIEKTGTSADGNDSTGSCTREQSEGSSDTSDDIPSGGAGDAKDSSTLEKCSQLEEQENNAEALKQVVTEGSVSSSGIKENSARQVENATSGDAEPPQQKAPALETKDATSSSTADPLDLSNISSAEELASKFSADQLKAELTRLGVKCGGTPRERADRLWFVKDLKPEEIPKKLRAKK